MIPIAYSAHKLTGYINSSTRPRHLLAANKLINQFKKVYSDHPRLSIYVTELCCAMQLKRIDIKLFIARNVLK